MRVKRNCLAIALSACLLPQEFSNAQDTGQLTLKSSAGRIAGTLADKDAKHPETGKPLLAVRTPAGGLIEIERTEATWQPADDLITQYAALLAQSGDGVEDHWKMVEWCLSQKGGRTKLGQQIDDHLLQIIRLSPQHPEATKELSRRKWIRVGGRWIPEAQYYSNLGFVYEKSRWISKVLSQVNQYLAGEEAKLGALKSELAKWKNQLPRYSFDEAVRTLTLFANESLIPILDKEAQDTKTVESTLRRIYVEVIGMLPSPTAQDSLIRFVLNDPDGEIRERAKELLLSPPFNSGSVTRFSTSSKLIGAGVLVPRDGIPNERLQYYAAFLGELGTLNSVLPLINAIKTVHRIDTGADPNRMSISQSTGQGGLQIGGGPKYIEKEFTNQNVLAALRRITKSNPGDSPELWRQWYLNQFTLSRFTVTADE